MMSTQVTKDQFEISLEGITHKPTGASFEPYPGKPDSGNWNDGRLGNVLPNGEDYRPSEVKPMQKLWAKYVSKNSKLFKPNG
jgi:hypothetical protein